MVLPRRSSRLLALAWGLTCLILAPAAAADSPTEYEVKAAFLANFGSYVEWPKTVRVDAEQVFRVCVLGLDPFGAALDETFQNKKIQGRPVMLKRVQTVADATDCGMIFIRLADPARLETVLQALRSRPVLTVADTADFERAGVMINMRLEGNKVRFNINQDAAESAGLKLSSQLLKLATRVYGGNAPGS